MNEASPGPLAGLRVLELPGAATLLLGKHCADLGAEVLRIEPPGGDPLRAHPPLLARDGDAPLSAVWLSYTLGKRSVALDLASAADIATLDRLAAGADIVVHALGPEDASRLRLDEEGARLKPGVIVVSITPFGASGPFAGRAASDLVQFAAGGYLYMTGAPEARPLRPSAPIQSDLHASNHAFVAALLALRRRRRTGEGAFIDQSARDAGVWMLTNTYQHWDLLRVNLRRQGQGRDMGAKKRLRAVYPSADGHVMWFFVTGHLGARSARALVEWMDRDGMAPDWLKAIDFEIVDLLSSEADLDRRMEEAFGAFFARKTGGELLDWALESGTMMAPVNSVADVAADRQLAARGAWRTVEQPEAGLLRVPGSPVQVDGMRWEPRGPGLANPPVRAEVLWPARAQNVTHGAANRLPLTGVNVVDFGTTLAGPSAARLLADFGATVIKVESVLHPDTLRFNTPYAAGAPGVDSSGYFAAYNAGKRSFALNLQAEDAHAVAERLVRWADVLVENYSPGVMDRLGLTRARLRAWNPRMVIASHSLQGQTGPLSRHRGYGQVAGSMTGWYDLTGDEGGPPLGPYSAYTDFLSWPLFAASILLALEERDATGRGGEIDHAQVESSLHFLAPLLLDYERSGRVPTRCGNHSGAAAPDNVYPCRGDDRWVAITADDEEAWLRVRRILGEADFDDGRFTSVAGRLAHEGALDEAISAVTVHWDAEELAESLERAGVPASIVAKGSDILSDEQLGHRAFFRRFAHPVIGDHAVLTQSFRISGMDAGPFSRAPLLGEHTFEIATEVLGMTLDEVADLAARGILQ